MREEFRFAFQYVLCSICIQVKVNWLDVFLDHILFTIFYQLSLTISGDKLFLDLSTLTVILFLKPTQHTINCEYKIETKYKHKKQHPYPQGFLPFWYEGRQQKILCYRWAFVDNISPHLCKHVIRNMSIYATKNGETLVARNLIF